MRNLKWESGHDVRSKCGFLFSFGGGSSSVERSRRGTKEKSDWVVAKFERTFGKHLISTEKRCRRIKTIFTGEDFVDISDLYVNLNLSFGENSIRDEDIVLKMSSYPRVVISGTGGAGKTMMMKYLALYCIDNHVKKIPLFIELRNLDEHIPANFTRTIFEYVADEQESDNYNVFREGLRNGAFIIFFDGLDEVSPTKRDQVFKSIRQLATRFPKTNIVASTRPEIDVRSWDDFHSLNVMGMTHNQATRLIKKIDFPIEMKSEFLDLNTKEFFEKHNSFLEVPLLCSLMLLTYNDYRVVPSRITVFYDQAFETLYRRHDRSKEGFYKRKFESDLSSDRFRQIFEVFCYKTLIKGKYSFSDSEIRDFISQSSSISEIDVSADSYASDLVSSICVVMRDGLTLHFIHRSFQEYFAAKFMLRYRGANTFEVFDRALSQAVINDVSKMAMDMDQQTFEREWAFPWLDKIVKSMRRLKPENRWLGLLRNTFHSLFVSGDPPSLVRTYAWSSSQEFNRPLLHLKKVYPKDIISYSPYSIWGTVKGAKSFCDLQNRYTIPDELREVCRMGYTEVMGEDEEEEEYVEFDIRNGKHDWLKSTTLYEVLVDAASELEALHEKVGARLKQREKIDVLR